MKPLLSLALLALICGPGLAHDLGHLAPAAPADSAPMAGRQGGDTIADAVALSLFDHATGSTAGYADDHDEACPYPGSTSPDVVYSLLPGHDTAISIDTANSSFDTKIYVYDAAMNVIACNDDRNGGVTSRLPYVLVDAGATYYVVVDGKDGQAGDYVLDVLDVGLCELTCQAGFQVEGEPALVDGYQDVFNSGCGGPGVPIQTVDSFFCGVSGWYTVDGMAARDTDWLEFTIPETGSLLLEADAEQPTYVFLLGPQDCNDVDVLQQITVGPCESDHMFINGDAGSTVWIWVGPTTFEGPVAEYDYILWPWVGGVATEAHSWTAVKGLFN